MRKLSFIHLVGLLTVAVALTTTVLFAISAGPAESATLVHHVFAAHSAHLAR